MKERRIWIDWMKVLGMLFIVWGHFTPNIMHNFIYAFNVPLFFCISGALTNVPSGGGKLWRSLLLPYITMAIILIPYNYIGSIASMHLNWKNMGYTVLAFITGEQRAVISSNPQVIYAPGCGTLWFVYALAIVKVLFRTTNKFILYVTLPLSLITAYIIPSFKPIGDYAVFTIPLAWFFFVVGYLIMHSSYFKSFHDAFKNKVDMNSLFVYIIPILVLLVSLIYFIAEANGQFRFFKADWGTSFLLMLIGSFFGITMVYIMSVALEVIMPKRKYLTVISNGTIIILAFHTQIIYILYRTFFYGRNDMMTLSFSVLIIIFFIPVIRFSIKYIPSLVGGRKF